MSEENDVHRVPVAQDSRALIVYDPPSVFTTMEQAILRHGTYREVARVLEVGVIRAMGIPSIFLGDNGTGCRN